MTSQAEEIQNNKVLMTTNFGDIEIELYEDKAPKTVANFLNYVQSGFYNGTLFHRVISNFMIQCGGFDEEFNEKEGNDTIENEADNGLSNTKGTLAMARTSEPHSASNQFFINVANNSFLDFKNKSIQGWGYAVFGAVTNGMDVVNKIRDVETGPKGMHGDVPKENVVILNMEIMVPSTE